jgi:predicted esterase
MPRSRCTRPGARLAVACLTWLVTAVAARADRVEMADGRVLEGRFALLPGVAVDPLAPQGPTAGTPILMCDDELTRTMVSKRQVAKTEPGPVDFGMEKIRIPQRVPENGRRVAGMGAAIEATPFDEFGRRILSLSTAGGRIDIVQGITEITPRWTRIEGLVTENPVVLDMRLATSALPRDVLKRVIEQHIDRTNADHRLRVVRLLIQAERYEDALRELDVALEDFPDLADLAAERRRIAELAARRILEEIRMRGRVGQDRLAMRLLESFPVEGIGGELLEEVREERDAYRDRQEAARALVARLRSRLEQLADPQVRAEAATPVAEIERELTFGTLDRLATFERLGADPDTPADRAIALAINGWLQGAGMGDDNLKVALSSVRLRDMLRDYLRSTEPAARDDLFARMRNEEAFAAAALAGIARHLRPPLDPPAAKSPGLFELDVPGLPGEATVRCLVQLPPEYDPLRAYPTIVTLHAAWTTPLKQVEWWAGLPAADGIRLGQATRHGFIVVAPAWAGEHQAAYEYSAREQAIVLASLREAGQRFAIDTDRVFLSGHSMGGDAAWDIGLAHPDLWAGVVAVSAASDRYVRLSWRNAATLPLYFVGGELDGGTIQKNAVDLDRYFLKGYDATYVEYRGRGHDHFSEELLRIFDWMGRKRRKPPQRIDVVSMRPWDRFFWWLEFATAPPKTVTLPANWPPAAGAGPLEIEGQVTPGNTVAARLGARGVRIWLAPEFVDLSRPVTVTLAGDQLFKGKVVPDERAMLEDLRRRGDRRHPFWAVVEGPAGR